MKHNQQLGKLRSYFPHNEPNKEPAVFDIFRRGLESKQVRCVKLMHLHLWGSMELALAPGSTKNKIKRRNKLKWTIYEA